MNEKVYTAWFPEVCAPTLVTRDMRAMGEFAREFERIVVKPLHGMGGRSIFVVDRQDKKWPEKKEREVRWWSAERAAKTVEHPKLSEIINRLARTNAD